MPGGQDSCDPAGVQEWPGMATDQEAAVYSGMVNKPKILLSQEGKGNQVLPSGLGSPPPASSQERLPPGTWLRWKKSSH